MGPVSRRMDIEIGASSGKTFMGSQLHWQRSEPFQAMEVMVWCSSAPELPSLTGCDAQQLQEGVHRSLVGFWCSSLDFRERERERAESIGRKGRRSRGREK
ncbi:hypothetical protein PanWU01x14_336630 [Parasponia andersonii]|uniref:Uncharacterized protein n=1 Tax=Parasponia andersonii TaxID=3476 RepID=A0A2P5AFV5_PARAD|nr:hypothetical protein PanWU01x14_336630 [Parasponia andersonii]